MKTIGFGLWTVTFDRKATTAAHTAMKSGGAEECRCGDCANFARQKPAPYPKEFLDLLNALGIDPQREIEVYNQYCIYEGEFLDYAGWFYFVGHVEGEGFLESGLFKWYLMEGPNYKVPEFEQKPVSRVEFHDFRLPIIDRS